MIETDAKNETESASIWVEIGIQGRLDVVIRYGCLSEESQFGSTDFMPLERRQV